MLITLLELLNRTSRIPTGGFKLLIGREFPECHVNVVTVIAQQAFLFV